MSESGRAVRIPVLGNAGPRFIVVEDRGDPAAEDVLLCLPGLLETSRVFAELAPSLGKGWRVVAINFAGRDGSDYLPAPSDYRMGAYVADIVATIAWLAGTFQAPAGKLSLLVSSHKYRPPARMHVLGNSMGGLLGAYVASRIPSHVHSLILNDVGCLLPWSGLAKLFGAIVRARMGGGLEPGVHSVSELARSLDIDPNLIAAVLNPSHLDLPHTSCMQGIDFEGIFAALDLPVLMMHSTESPIVTPVVVERMRATCRQLQMVALPGERHPLPIDENYIELIRRFVADLRAPGPATRMDGGLPVAVL